MRHRCNQVIDPASCCPAAHGAPLNECTCNDWEKVVGDVPGADLGGYCRFAIQWLLKKKYGWEEADWNRYLQRWDDYEWRLRQNQFEVVDL